MRMSIRNITPMIGLVAIVFGVTPAQAQTSITSFNGPDPLYCGCSAAATDQMQRMNLRNACDAVAEATAHRVGINRPPTINDNTVASTLIGLDDAQDLVTGAAAFTIDVSTAA